MSDPETVLGTVEAVCTKAGMSCRREAGRAGETFVEARQRAPWYRLLLERLPQRVTFRVVSEGDRITVSARFALFRWFGLLLGGAMLLLPAGLLVALLETDPARLGAEDPVMVSAGVLGLGLLLWRVPYLLDALGGPGLGMLLWDPIVARVEVAGGWLEPCGRIVARPFTRAFFAMIGPVALLAALFLGAEMIEAWARSPLQVIVLSLLYLSALVLLAGLVVFRHRVSASLRLAPVVLGLPGLIVAVCFVLPPQLLLLYGIDADRLGAVVADPAPEECLPGEARGSSLDGAVPASSPHLVRSSRLTLGLLVLLVPFGLGLAVWSLESVARAGVSLGRLSRHRDRGAFRRAVGEPGALRPVRWYFGAIWCLLVGVILPGWALLGGAALHAAYPLSTAPELRLAEPTAALLAIALERPLSDPWVRVPVRTGWALYGLLAWGLLGLSVGQLLFQQRRGRLVRYEPPEGIPREVRRLFARLCRRAGLGPVRLVLFPEARIAAASFERGLWRPRRVVAVSRGALKHLDDEEIEALLAHELAHHLRGQVRRDLYLRLLGRLTFLGDGVVTALQPSFGDELDTDRVAVEPPLEASPEALARCLIKIRHLNKRLRSGGTPPETGLLMGADADRFAPGYLEALEALSRWERIRLGFRLFRQQYTGSGDVGTRYQYWHPVHRERILALGASGRETS